MPAQIVDGALTRQLRRTVLRPELSADEPLPGDDLDEVVHFGVLAQDGSVLSTCFVFLQPCPWLPGPAGWHLRQMATEPKARGRGLAAEVLVAVVEDDGHRRRLIPRGLHYEPLVDDPYRVVVPAAWGDVYTLDEVGDRPWVDAPPGSAVAQTLRRMRRTTGLAFPPAHSCIEFTAALALVSAGLAGAFIPLLALRAAPEPDEVRVLTVDGDGLGGRRLGVLYRDARNEPTPTVVAVLGALRAAV